MNRGSFPRRITYVFSNQSSQGFDSQSTESKWRDCPLRRSASLSSQDSAILQTHLQSSCNNWMVRSNCWRQGDVDSIRHATFRSLVSDLDALHGGGEAGWGYTQPPPFPPSRTNIETYHNQAASIRALEDTRFKAQRRQWPGQMRQMSSSLLLSLPN
jgi:hypothetical protein